ncbi:hypothetical protein Enr13x_12580 [Stieleria neptunia]|uniref:Uncharacterized protein n=1 Tax=Stieleria neptunia TaxID=2527979 RepID=A0A518HKX5_9BACT|nr:hypothetical protein Enr13x_12580 [Stieleria neptunia]
MTAKVQNINRAKVTVHTFGDARRCPTCGSTQRGKYGHSRTSRLTPTKLEPWTHLVARRCKCAKCETPRIDYFREIRTDDQSN